MIEELILNGMDVARLNFAHASFAEHQENIQVIRKAATKLGRTVAILADLPGPKIRIGKLKFEPVILKRDSRVSLVTKNFLGTAQRIPCEFKDLPRLVSKDSLIYLSDGFIQLKVLSVRGQEVVCRVMVGGSLLSHKGLNLPGAKLPMSAFTAEDRDILQFALKQGVDAVGVSFVENASDILKIKDIAARRGKHPMIVAKIERQAAVANSAEILNAADAVMIARGDLGVEIPLEQVPVVQKTLIREANLLGKPVITATQMLESMTDNIRPTRAEAADVANAILDGTDAIMLSEETAVGRYPVDAVKIMAKIAAATEPMRGALGSARSVRQRWKQESLDKKGTAKESVTLHAVEMLESLAVRAILAPTASGDTARRISRFKPDCWILAFTKDATHRNGLAFSCGVMPFPFKSVGLNRDDKILTVVKRKKLVKPGDQLLMIGQALVGVPEGANSLKIVTVD